MSTASAYDLTALREHATRIALAAGEAILDIYRAGGEEPVEFTLKDDASPLTRADLASHEIITTALRDLTPGTPILSEESASDVSHGERRAWRRFWLVDPLDGTKEFIKRNGEFTVNIALIEDGRPILGVVHARALELTYAAAQGTPPGRRQGRGSFVPVRPKGNAGDPVRVVASRSHAGPETTLFLEALRARHTVEVVSRGSSLKVCQVAEGSADVYPRLGPTMEWDTAAAHAVAEQAGAHVVGLDGSSLRYNKPDLTNPQFLVSAAKPGPYFELMGLP